MIWGLAKSLVVVVMSGEVKEEGVVVVVYGFGDQRKGIQIGNDDAL